MTTSMTTIGPLVVHHTGFQHIDGIAVGSEVTAVATSSLTGDLWNGTILLMRNQKLASADGVQQPVCALQTAQGNAGVAWVSDDILASGDDSGDVALWQIAADKTAAKPLLRFGEHTQPITCMVAGPQDGSRLASTSLDGTAKVWQASIAGGNVATFEHLSKHAWCDVQVHGATWLGGTAQQTLATVASDGVLRLWDVRRAPPSADRFAMHSAPLLTVATGAADCQLLAGSECGAVFLADARRLDAPVATMQVSTTSAVCSLAPSGHGSYNAAVGTEDGGIVHLDARDLKLLSRATMHQGRVGALAWLSHTSDGGELLSGGWDKQLVRHSVASA